MNRKSFKKLTSLVVMGTVLLACSNADINNDNEKVHVTVENTESEAFDTIASEWIIETSKAEIGSKEICHDFMSDVILHLQFSWKQKAQNVVRTDTGTIFDMTYTQPFDINSMLRRSTSLEIQNVSKIVLNRDYAIPNETMYVESLCNGFYSNFEYYKNLSGKIRFEELANQEVRFKILLMGELNQMLKLEMDTILNEEISFTKLRED